MIPPTLNSPIIFDISATGLSTASFVQNDNFLFFAAEISGNFNNFVVGAPTEIISAVPLPAALPLFATGLGALGLLGWRRKKAAAG